MFGAGARSRTSTLTNNNEAAEAVTYRGEPTRGIFGVGTRMRGPYRGPRVFGAGARSRTRDLRFTKPLLYQLSYTGYLCAIP